MRSFRFISLLILFVAGCSDTQEQTGEILVYEKTDTISEICEVPALETASNNFLNALNEKDLITARSFYFPASLSDGVGYGVEYTFFRESETVAFFDFEKKNMESPFKTHILGEYDDGYLVTFIQEQHRALSRDPEFLTYGKFDGFFACLFQCIEGEWRITKQTCFEDSGGPFFIPEESDLEE